MTEQQRFEVLEQHEGFELRRYPEHVVADVTRRGSFEHAAYSGFQPLVSYISAGGVAMTAPVLQDAPATALAPGDPLGTDTWRVSFVMPDGADISSLPVPGDARVTLRHVPEHRAAVARFSGRWSSRSFRRHTEALAAAVTNAGLDICGPARWARFDPPWTPWFLRHNEVVLPIQ